MSLAELNLASAKEELLKIEETENKELFGILSAFTPEQINKIPYEGSWTPGQVVEHLYKSDTGILKTLENPIGPAERPIDSSLQQLKDVFLDFESKLNTPQSLQPANTTYKKEDILHSLERSRAAIHEAITTSDLTIICPNPLIGDLTKYEILRFVFFHTQRHIHQLRKIAKHLSAH